MSFIQSFISKLRFLLFAREENTPSSENQLASSKQDNENVHRGIFPRLSVNYKHEDYRGDSRDKKIEAMKQRIPEDNRLVKMELTADLNVTFRIQHNGRTDFLRRGMVESVDGIGIEGIFEIGKRNLRRTLGEKIRMDGDADDIITVTADENQEASLILLDDFWNEVHALMGSMILVIIPCRSKLYLCNVKAERALERMQKLAVDSYAQCEHDMPLSKMIYLRTRSDGKLAVLEPFI